MNRSRDNIYIAENEKVINLWKGLAIWIITFFLVVGATVIIIKISKNENNRTLSEESKSYIVTYENVLYHVVPNDLLKENDKYKQVLDKYNISKYLQKENIGSCVYKSDKYMLYKVKERKTKDILIMKDTNGDFVYVFSEKLFG